MFLDPVVGEFYGDWESTARAKVAHFRAIAGRNLHDSRVTDLIEELSDESPEFRDAWARYDVQVEPGRRRRFRHELVGELTVNTEVFSLAGSPGQHLITLQADHDTHSAEALDTLCREAPLDSTTVRGFGTRRLRCPRLRRGSQVAIAGVAVQTPIAHDRPIGCAPNTA